MKPALRYTILSVSIASLAACSSGDNSAVDPSPSQDSPDTFNEAVDMPDDDATDTNDNGNNSDSDNLVDFGDLPPPTIPPVDLLAAPIPGPDLSDPFGSLLEIDTQEPVIGGGPTIPKNCLLYTSPSPRDRQKSRMPSSA